MDGSITVISALNINNAKIQIVTQQPLWNEWEIDWNQILLSPLNFILIVMMILILIIAYTKSNRPLKFLSHDKLKTNKN
jgi:large-conductance mechanosensitive channel